MPQRFTAIAATAPGYELAEGVLWDDLARRIRWVDIWVGDVLSGVLVGDRIEDTTAVSLGQTVGTVTLAEDGGLLVAGARGLVTIAPDGQVLHGPDLLGDRQAVRFNDGSVDPLGNLVVGSSPLGERTGTEVLLRVTPDGDVETLRRGILLSNGIGWSPDGATIYHVDTWAKTVSSHSYGPQFDHDEPWQTLPLEYAGFPDGLRVDSEGMLWVAQFSAGRVQRHAPSGELLAVVEVDATQPTCMGFVGDGLDRLAITTGTENLESYTDKSGALFLADVGVTGLPVTRWRGSTTTPYWTQGEA